MSSPSAARPRIHPRAQPVRPAIALVVVSVVSAVLMALSYLAELLLGDGVVQQMLSGDPTATVALLMVLALVFVALALGLGLAGFILSVVVAVKGDGKLRLGAVIMLIASAAGMVVSFTVSGDPAAFSDAAVAISNAFSLLDAVVEVLRVLGMLAGVVVLVLGIREVQRERADQPL
ncbi:hypothetical protein ACT3SP_00670 [Brachybacterium sp. AOP43-C2-M15]|uniref:hypothetical protein n=1 Tax=Brachybacterium sp. AOP43-C2-M15 TaxID=3457661 RepID=UPI0040342D9C